MTSVLIAPLALALAAAASPPAAAAAPVTAGALMAAAPYWPPSERSKKASGSGSGSSSSSGSSSGSGSGGGGSAAKKPAKPRSSGGGGGSASSKSTDRMEREVLGGGSSGGGSSSSADDEAEEDTRAAPPARRKARASRRDEEEEEDSGEDEEDDARPATVSLPVVAPRLISFGLGGALVGRRFQFDAPLQQEKTFPRMGVAATLETFPLMSLRGWFSHLGLGASFERDFGSASLKQADGGTLGYPVTEARWSFDARYAFQLGSSFVLVPMLGYGRSGYDVQRTTETTNPSMCNGAATQVCLPDVTLSFMKVGFVGRVAFTPSFGMSFGAAYLPAFGVGRAMGALGAEAAPSTTGFSGELGASWMLTDWLALRASVPIVRYGYSWSGTTMSYRSASEMYYSTIVGATVFTR